jgi:hypothetical protein
MGETLEAGTRVAELVEHPPHPAIQIVRDAPAPRWEPEPEAAAA